MNIFELIYQSYPDTVNAVVWLVVFALSASALILMVGAFNSMSRKGEPTTQRQWRSETKEFLVRLETLTPSQEIHVL